jgi:EpsI family protein
LPEMCYPAQGYKVLNLTTLPLPVGAQGTTVPGKHMVASGNNRTEAVTYWTRIGDAYPEGGLAMRMKIFRDGLAGIVADGILVRSSMLVRDESDTAKAYELQQQFLSQLVEAASGRGDALVAAKPGSLVAQ